VLTVVSKHADQCGGRAGRGDAALGQLAAVYKRFDGSFHSADVVAAREMLEARRII
jgi:hypothetical protein